MRLFDMMTNEDIKRLRDSTIEALELENKKLKDKVREAEGETSIVKAVGLNSPEMRVALQEVEKLKADLARAKEDHQYDNMVHQKELESLKNK